MCKVGMVEIGCGGYLGGTPPIGKLELLGLLSGEMVLQDGWQGRMDTSKCGNAGRFGTHMCMCMHRVPEGDGRWWWALNGCTNQPEGWPLGPVVGQTAPGAGMAGMDRWVQMQHDLAGDGGGHVCMSETLPGVAGEWWWASNECASLPKEGPLGPVLKRSHSRMWVTRWATASKCGDVTGFGTCMAAPGCGKIDKMSMERVYGGHINGAPSMGKMAVRPVCVCGDFMNWPGVHGVDWVKPKTALHMDIPMVHKTPLGTGMGCACLSGQHGVWFLVVAGASWGCAI